MIPSIKKIAVIGSGTMGNGIAHVFAQYGFSVSLIDISKEQLDRGMDNIRRNLDRMLAKQKITAKQKDDTLKGISAFTKTEDGVKDADLVIEAATETVEIKLDIFRQLDSLCKDSCILASNTSSISITKIASVTKRPQKVIGMHFMNPVPVMKLVEVIRGYSTTDEVTKTIIELTKKIDKIPVEVNDYPGFVSNRVLMPMINEAVYCVYENVATPEAIDNVMKLGMAHPMGPLRLADFIGLDVCLSIMNVLYEGLGDPKYSPCPLLKKMVTAGHLGNKTGRGFFEYPEHSG